MLRITLGLFLVVSLLSGCITWVQVKPQEIEKLSAAEGPGAAPVTLSSGGHVAVFMVPLSRPDGRLIQVPRNTTVRVILTDQRVLYFYPPLQARVDGDNLQIHSANYTPMTLSLRSIRAVEVPL